jgi:hypothetical protein
MIWNKPFFFFLIASSFFLIAPGNRVIRAETGGKGFTTGQLQAVKGGAASIIAPGTTFPESKRPDKVKHHQRTIASEAILLDFSIPPPQFSFCQTNYSPFLPGKCCSWRLSGSSLRGPPFSDDRSELS